MANREKEYAKYEKAYKNPAYRMGNNRRKSAEEYLIKLPFRGSYLDVGCGRGEMLTYAEMIGFDPTIGVDVVSYLLNEKVIYGEAHSLPFEDDSFDVVTSFDVFEHLLPEDTESALKEIDRVSKKAIILVIPNHPSGMNSGDNYHINLRGFNEWDRLIKANIAGEVERLPGPAGVSSKTWVITKE